MRRVLLDENLPRKLRRDFSECFVRTVQEERWTSYANGELLRRAQVTFDVFLTADRRLQYQQRLPQFSIGVVVIVTPSIRLATIRTAIEPIKRAVLSIGTGELIEVHVA